MLEGEDRERALKRIDEALAFRVQSGLRAVTKEPVLAALEREFVLVRPAPEKGSCEPCLLWGSCPLSENLAKSSVRDKDVPGPNCPARKEEG